MASSQPGVTRSFHHRDMGIIASFAPSFLAGYSSPTAASVAMRPRTTRRAVRNVSERIEARVDLNVAERVPDCIIVYRPGVRRGKERRWSQTLPKARIGTRKYNDWLKGNAHIAAASGYLDAIIAISEKNPDALKNKDSNGWNPLHEACRGGHLEVMEFLIKGGLDKNERTHNGNGGSPLWWSKKAHGKTHPVVQYLESLGAEEIPPEGLDTIK